MPSIAFDGKNKILSKKMRTSRIRIRTQTMAFIASLPVTIPSYSWQCKCSPQKKRTGRIGIPPVRRY